MHRNHPALPGNEHSTHIGLDRNERRTRVVVVLAAVVMVVEIVAGHITGSLALTADGWHMATHAAALGLSVTGYWFARTRAGRPEFSFGTGKVYALVGYTSALLIAGVAVWMLVESVSRIVRPIVIDYRDALPVAILGLVVNVLSLWLLGAARHDAGHVHDARHAHAEDHNMRSAYLHVAADAVTSVLAIGALLAGLLLGWTAFDPIAGLIGGLAIGRWALQLCRTTGAALLDVSPCPDAEARVRAALEAIDDVRVLDFHLWQLGPGRRACVAAILAGSPRETSFYRQRVLDVEPLAHLTIEVHQCGCVLEDASGKGVRPL